MVEVRADPRAEHLLRSKPAWDMTGVGMLDQTHTGSPPALLVLSPPSVFLITKHPEFPPQDLLHP